MLDEAFVTFAFLNIAAINQATDLCLARRSATER
jgi:hypothetical protein